MEHIINWLNNHEIAVNIFLLLTAIIVLVFIVMLVISFMQGRKITIWKITFGEKPPNKPSNSILNIASQKKYDLFISAPMTSISAEDYSQTREDILSIMKHFRDKCGMKNIHYVGERVTSPSKVDPPVIAIEDDLNNLSRSKCFILIYPKSMLTSCIVEAGYALGINIPSIYFVKNKDDLPYMLREVAASKNSVSVYEYKDTEDLIRLIDQHKKRLFKTSQGDTDEAHV